MFFRFHLYTFDVKRGEQKVGWFYSVQFGHEYAFLVFFNHELQKILLYPQLNRVENSFFIPPN